MPLMNPSRSQVSWGQAVPETSLGFLGGSWDHLSPPSGRPRMWRPLPSLSSLSRPVWKTTCAETPPLPQFPLLLSARGPHPITGPRVEDLTCTHPAGVWRGGEVCPGREKGADPGSERLEAKKASLSVQPGQVHSAGVGGLRRASMCPRNSPPGHGVGLGQAPGASGGG